MKITLFLFALITMAFQTAISQNFTNLSKLVRIHKNHDTDYLIKKGFERDTAFDHEVWTNNSTDERVDVHEDVTYYYYEDMIIDKLIGEINYTGKILNKIWIRPWWFSDKAEFKKGAVVHADYVKVKRHWVSLYYDPYKEMMAVSVYK